MKSVRINSRMSCSFCGKEILQKDLGTHIRSCMEYVNNQNIELKFENSVLKTEIRLLKTKNSALKATMGMEKEKQ